MKRKVLLLFLLAVLTVTFLILFISCKDDIKMPVFEIVSLKSTKESIEFEINETDPNSVGEIRYIELYKNGVKVKTAKSTDVRMFDNLAKNTKYTVKVTYSYDLQNGEGEKTDSAFLDISTINEGFSSKFDVKRDWEGKTLNIACSTWSSSESAPWSVIELCAKEGKESGFGTKIDTAIIERQRFIEQNYGVKLNWIASSRFNISDGIDMASIAENINYDLALPRALNAQSIVVKNSVYDMNNRNYIDFSNPYYNKDSVETYTAKGHTFFLDGEFSTLSKELSHVLFFNKRLLGGEQATTDLYSKVREGKWTWNDLATLGNAVYRDNGDGIYYLDDTYGIDRTALLSIPYGFGVKRASVDKSTGEWKLSLKDLEINKIVELISSAMDSNWTRSAWNSGTWGENETVKALTDGTLLFYHETVSFTSYGKNEGIGVVPLPMLSEDQGRYYTPLTDLYLYLMCIPKTTQDREMSDYFVDVLAWTGNEYTVTAYFEQKAEILQSDEDMEMLVNYVFPNAIYDAGAAVGWSQLFINVEFHKGVDEFTDMYNAGESKALETIAEWNNAWGSYTEN